jgi:carboxyl-terminal processing protease
MNGSKLMVNIKRARLTLLSIFAVAVIFSLGYIAGTEEIRVNAKDISSITIDRTTPADKNVDFALFWKVWDTLGASYVDKSKLVPSQMVNGAIKGMVASLGDPYTSFLTPSENKVTQEDLQGNFDGVGIQIGYRQSQLAVIAPLPGSPAEKAGIKAGDYILKIEDEKKDITRETGNISLPEAVQIIRGTKGTHVKLTTFREGDQEPKEVDLVRETIDVPSVVYKSVGDGKVAHLRVLKFGAETKAEWNKGVSDAISSGTDQNIILDLRNNPGGYLQASVDLAGEFVPAGTIIVTEERGDGQKTNYKTQTVGKLSKSKVIILVNKGSASASEILAGALRDQMKYKIFGETSFGKGTVQEPIQLESGAGLHVTIAKWLTPNGTWVHEKGLTPDTEVKDNPDTVEDEQLQSAIDAIVN